jgi:leucyl aminopeptidase (aminopeptidase T)
MELALGTEPRQEYYAFELAAGAKKLVEDIMRVKAGENVAITADTASDWRVVQAVAQAAFTAGARPVVLWYETQPNAQMEPPPPVARAVEVADVWIELAVAYILYTEARQRATQAGCRYACMSGMDVDMIVRTIGRVNYPKMLELGDKLCELTQQADEIHMTSPAGTDLLAHQGGRPVRQSGGLGDKKGASVMLGGQVAWLPLIDSIQGTLVFDGALWPPAELGVLSSPVTLTMEKGFVKEISGGAEASVFEKWLSSFDDPNMYRMAHYTYGFNPGVTRPMGRIVEDERIFGCVEFGIGSTMEWRAASHTDGVVLNPSVWLDGKSIEEHGKYVHPDLARICREMNMPGY